jgi:ABC-type Fe3+-hydroxamate transport system substrate-binding protein
VRRLLGSLAVLAPVGVTDWMGFENGIGPWAQEAAKAAGDPPELLTNTDGIRFEKIAALRPDVIGDLEARIAKASEEHPEFAGRSASMAMAYEGIWVYGPDDPARACSPISASGSRPRSPSCS